MRLVVSAAKDNPNVQKTFEYIGQEMQRTQITGQKLADIPALQDPVMLDRFQRNVHSMAQQRRTDSTPGVSTDSVSELDGVILEYAQMVVRLEELAESGTAWSEDMRNNFTELQTFLNDAEIPAFAKYLDIGSAEQVDANNFNEARLEFLTAHEELKAKITAFNRASEPDTPAETLIGVAKIGASTLAHVAASSMRGLSKLIPAWYDYTTNDVGNGEQPGWEGTRQGVWSALSQFAEEGSTTRTVLASLFKPEGSAVLTTGDGWWPAFSAEEGGSMYEFARSINPQVSESFTNAVGVFAKNVVEPSLAYMGGGTDVAKYSAGMVSTIMTFVIRSQLLPRATTLAINSAKLLAQLLGHGVSAIAEKVNPTLTPREQALKSIELRGVQLGYACTKEKVCVPVYKQKEEQLNDDEDAFFGFLTHKNRKIFDNLDKCMRRCHASTSV